MNDVAMIWVLAALLGFRVLVLIRFWRIPHTLVKDRFFGLPLAPSVSQPLLRRYHNLLFVSYLIDVCCGLAIAGWGGTYSLLIEQVVALVLARICYSLIGIHIIRQAKLRAVEGSWKPVRTVALMLTTRRLRDYVSIAFEILLPLFTAGTFALLAYQLWRNGEAEANLRQSCTLAVLALYLQLGGLLIKHALVKWRWRMPGQRVDEYVRWREAVLRYWLWVCDYFRCVFTVGLLAFVAIDVLIATGARDKTILMVRLIVAGGIILAGILGFERQQKRLKPLWEALRPLEDFSLPPEIIDNKEFFLGGICYFNAENPALFVPGPLVYAINMANRRTYLYAAYVAVLVSLGVWCGVAQPRAAGANEESPVSENQHPIASVNPPMNLTPEALRALAAGVRELVEDDEAVGAEVLILHHRKVVLHEAYGWADLDRHIPLKPNAIACVRSMTKPLVGTAIQMLIDEGKLTLADRASQFLPAFDNDKSRPITIEQLLTHSAGFPLTRISKQLTAYSGQREVADQAGQLGPDGPPGKFRYSDCDSETLAAVISVVAGEPADAFIRRRILEPLGMKDTYCVLEKKAPGRSRVSSNHAGSPGLWHKYWDHEEKPFFPFFLGAASAYSTAADYAKFLTLWLDKGWVNGKRLLSQAAVDRAFKPAYPMLTLATNLPFPTGLKPLRPFYGQHWLIYQPSTPDKSQGSLPVFGHSGSDGTLSLAFPEQDLMAFYFTQSRGGMSPFRFEELLTPLVGLEPPPAHTRLSVDQVQPYLGSYQEFGSSKRAWVTLRDKRLRLELPGAGALLPRWPTASGRWEFGESEPGVSVSFDKTDTGQVTGMHVWMHGTELVQYKRLTNDKDLPNVEHVMALRKKMQGGGQIETLRSLEIKGKLKVGATELDNWMLAAGSDRVIRRIDAPAGRTTTTVNGARAQKQSPDQTIEELHGLLREEAMRLNPLARLRDWRESFRAVQIAGKDRVGEEEVWIVRIESEFSPPVTRYVSAKTGLLLTEESWITSKGIGTVPISIEYEDYREVAGVKIPFRLKTESRLTGKQVMQFTEAKANVAISDGTFRLPKQ